jgi:hypothetical protein
MVDTKNMLTNSSPNPINRLIRFCLDNQLVVVLVTIGLIFWGVLVAPFDWEFENLPRDPVPVDAIPDIGENQQIVFTKWNGRSPQDIEDQITYPLTTALLGLPQVKSVRSYSMFGFSSIYIIFKEEVEFYWSRSRILEKLSSLPSGTLPDGVSPQLGPDATALGQVFWYTLEGLDKDGNPTGGWDLDELRSVQDWHVRYALQSVDGVAEVASIGGFVKEYQVDVDPDALRRYEVSLSEVYESVRASNLDVGARTIEINSAEYVIRGVGFIENLDDLRKTVITQRNNVPVTLDEVAEIEYGPALRRGVLDKAGAEAVGGVVVTRFGENPLAVIQRIKEKIEQVSPGLPRKTLDPEPSSLPTNFNHNPSGDDHGKASAGCLFDFRNLTSGCPLLLCGYEDFQGGCQYRGSFWNCHCHWNHRRYGDHLDGEYHSPSEGSGFRRSKSGSDLSGVFRSQWSCRNCNADNPDQFLACIYSSGCRRETIPTPRLHQNFCNHWSHFRGIAHPANFSRLGNWESIQRQSGEI